VRICLAGLRVDTNFGAVEKEKGCVVLVPTICQHEISVRRAAFTARGLKPKFELPPQVSARRD